MNWQNQDSRLFKKKNKQKKQCVRDGAKNG